MNQETYTEWYNGKYKYTLVQNARGYVTVALPDLFEELYIHIIFAVGRRHIVGDQTRSGELPSAGLISGYIDRHTMENGGPYFSLNGAADTDSVVTYRYFAILNSENIKSISLEKIVAVYSPLSNDRIVYSLDDIIPASGSYLGVNNRIVFKVYAR